MINLLIGPPGGGKSYEAVVYHVMPALSEGRRVITNLPLNLDKLRDIDAAFPALVVKVENRRGMVRKQASRFVAPVEEEGIIRAFSTMADYADPWRHPVTGAGPLYVIDECHLALPRAGTVIEIEEWFSLHRHESADVLLITQSYGKVSKSIIDLVQVCYRVKKGTAFGTAKKYIRKVQDGVRGDVVNTSIRQYQKRYFGLYQSHTRGGGSELAAQDIVPFWQRWPFIALGLCAFAAVGIFTFGGVSINPMKAAKTAEAPKPVKVVEQTTVNGKVVSSSEVEPEPPAPVAEDAGLPFEGKTLHVIGTIINGAKARVLFAVASGNRFLHEISGEDLVKLGYSIDAVVPCAVKVSNGTWHKWVICDAPVPERIPGGAYDLPENRNRSAGGGPRNAGGTPADGVMPPGLS
ncbi:MAG: hypothetical protein FIB06_00650 [Betaproteobacteria bacterium]|nr:hypothetical protein [Betaproteobacteria bacterium]